MFHKRKQGACFIVFRGFLLSERKKIKDRLRLAAAKNSGHASRLPLEGGFDKPQGLRPPGPRRPPLFCDLDALLRDAGSFTQLPTAHTKRLSLLPDPGPQPGPSLGVSGYAGHGTSFLSMIGIGYSV
ncbi:hypothetical protein QR97_12845 [Streptomyces sp. PBH53]|nr:hypothetical protein QR97_12845 [Streptomyces sp. PBH53]